MKADPNKTAKQLLDRAAKNLSANHAERLEDMTLNAEAHYFTKNELEKREFKKRRFDKKQLKHRPSYPNRFIHSRFSLPLVMASSALFVVWLAWSEWHPTRLQNDPMVANAPPITTTVPDWVLDTSVPISLLKNKAFYDWLAAQEDVNKHG